MVEVMETLGSDEALPSAKLLPMKMKINTFSSLKGKKFLSCDSTRTLIAVCQMTSNKKNNFWFLKMKYFLFMENTEPHLLWGRNIHLMKD